ncbi:hypothetical protein KFZ58_06585 [Virgibacillus sp. NKC19-16]|uniref:hypothetical protein n=1 Tax=Virgibacillus salidurans TaxID=2831673 RepID=UPI001F1764E0|nr:hypothetical protein [Virgibacillus sp. NKC19-16]UJL47531.1 hypothetical protein KFZ58_06585 [Virgibacillus sp. NKC19-16]
MAAFIRNCRLCKEPMESSPFMMCETCLRETDRVRNFIRKNPHVSIKEISLSTDIPQEKAQNMIKLIFGRKTV